MFCGRRRGIHDGESPDGPKHEELQKRKGGEGIEAVHNAGGLAWRIKP